MSRRRAIDYIAVFQKLKEIMPLPRVERIVTDFERAVFVAVRKLFPSCFHLGCNFHWCQAIMKKIRDFNLSTEYNKKGPNPVRDFVFRLLCLAYLPADKIPSVFDSLRTSVPPILETLMDYMERNWIRGRFWTPVHWSCFNLLLKTNNDCEGLHNDWNKLAGGPNLPFYKMTLVLEQLCQDLSTMELLEEIVLELKTSFPTVVTDHPLNLNDENIDNYDMSFESDDEL
ncbi:uncharacterized protein LOC123467841 [Daphnia magna]|nr:uncharacterized protein LOC123467841 [Daphnia magna]